MGKKIIAFTLKMLNWAYEDLASCPTRILQSNITHCAISNLMTLAVAHYAGSLYRHGPNLSLSYQPLSAKIQPDSTKSYPIFH